MRATRALPLLLLAVATLRAQTVEKALQAIADNDTRAAERELEALRQARAGDREVELARGVYLFQLGKFVEARQALQPLASDPRAETFLLLARAATGECAAVGKTLQLRFDAAADPRLRRLAGLGAAQCAIAAADAPAATALLARLRQLYPADADVLYLAARFHLKAWNDVVYDLFQKAPASYRVNQISAEIFEIQGNYGAAVSEYRKAIEKDPAAVNLHYRLGRALLLESHEPAALEQARLEFEREIQLNPNDAVAEYQVGQILVAQQKLDLARPRLERALEIQPDFAEAALALGRLYLQSKDTARAIAALETAVRQAPESEPAHYNLMLAYRNAGRYQDALREKTELEKLQKPPAGEFSDFLKKLGEKQPPQPPPPKDQPRPEPR